MPILPDPVQGIFNQLRISPSVETFPDRIDKHGNPEKIYWLKSNTVYF